MNLKKAKNLVNKWIKLRQRANKLEKQATQVRESWRAIQAHHWMLSNEYPWDLTDKASKIRRKMDRIQVQIEEAGIDFHGMLSSSSFSSLRRN